MRQYIVRACCVALAATTLACGGRKAAAPTQPPPDAGVRPAQSSRQAALEQELAEFVGWFQACGTNLPAQDTTIDRSRARYGELVEAYHLWLSEVDSAVRGRRTLSLDPRFEPIAANVLTAFDRIDDELDKRDGGCNPNRNDLIGQAAMERAWLTLGPRLTTHLRGGPAASAAAWAADHVSRYRLPNQP